MQVLFKTRYADDIHFLAKTGEKVRVGLVVAFLLAAPLLLQNYYLAELGLLLVYAIAGIGLMILTGHTGQVSFGHAAFLGIGAYCHSILMSHGVPFSVSVILTTTLCGLVGLVLGRSASKMHGFYLAIATLAFLILIETLLGEWEGMTGGYAGFKVPALKIFGLSLKAVWQQYYIDLFFVLLVAALTAALFIRDGVSRHIQCSGQRRAYFVHAPLRRLRVYPTGRLILRHMYLLAIHIHRYRILRHIRIVQAIAFKLFALHPTGQAFAVFPNPVSKHLRPRGQAGGGCFCRQCTHCRRRTAQFIISQVKQ